jgi:ATP-binding cassette subfamily G (WHITE) protein 2 (PDR)
LDAATALKFVQALRVAADLGGSAYAVAFYQASQAIYDTFDKVIVLYEGRQIFFGHSSKAKAFFINQGWDCPPRQTTGDFLTSVTNSVERKARKGMEKGVPRTPDEFEAYWKNSAEYRELQREVHEYEEEFPIGGDTYQQLYNHKRDMQAKHTRPESPYIISIPMQIRLNTVRAYQQIWGDISFTVTTIIVQGIIALIVGFLFYDTPNATAGFFAKGSALFFGVLLNALLAVNEINNLYDQRPIVEKHKSYAFYHPLTEALGGIVSDLPVKFGMSVVFNIILYFMVGLRREPGPFFLYFLVTFTSTFVMSAIFRTLAALTITISQAMSLAGVMILAIVVYTGYVVPGPYMHPWFAWIKWVSKLSLLQKLKAALGLHDAQTRYTMPLEFSWRTSFTDKTLSAPNSSPPTLFSLEISLYVPLQAQLLVGEQ